MSQISERIFGAIAITLTLGAVQFASGHDLTGGLLAATSMPDLKEGLLTATSVPATAVNRTIKTDRAVRAAPASGATQTISIRLDGLSDTSILVRMPLVRDTRNTAPAANTPPPPKKSGNPRLTVACEPVVSVLTEVAKLLQPGRCIT